MKYIELIGRILYSIIFLRTLGNHFDAKLIEYAAFHNVPIPSLLVPFSGLLAVIGAISIVIGYKTKWGALLISLFLIPVTLYMHAFWAETDPMQMQSQMTNFMKNTSMLGAALIISYFGAGPLSMDAKTKTKIL